MIEVPRMPTYTCDLCTALRAAIDRHLARCSACHQGLMNVIGDLDAQVRRLSAENLRLRAELLSARSEAPAPPLVQYDGK
jgi:hypothetical protein